MGSRLRRWQSGRSKADPLAPPPAWKQHPLSREHVMPQDRPLPFRGGAGAPLARQRGGRPRWRDTPAESSRAPVRRRSCGRGGVDAGGPRRGRGRPAGQERCSGGWRRTRPQTELAESEERDPPTGPARHRLRGRGTTPRQWHQQNQWTAVLNRSGSSRQRSYTSHRVHAEAVARADLRSCRAPRLARRRRAHRSTRKAKGARG